MSRHTEWSYEAIHDLRDLPDWRIAADVSRAVEDFASTGRGFVRLVPNPGGFDELRLYVPGRAFYVRIRHTDAVLYVERVLPRS